MSVLDKNRLLQLSVSFMLMALILGNGSSMMMPVGARSMALGDLTFSVYPRIFTPNGDSANDKAAFHFDNPQDLPVEGTVFDLQGAKVADLTPGSDPAALLLWDGKDREGRTVPGGIYLYQLVYQGKRATGTVVVAR
jgi:hypothetical protein